MWMNDRVRYEDGEFQAIYSTAEEQVKDGHYCNSCDPYYDLYTGDIEIMQSTGLMDKNGKEIYEGDIIAPIRRKIKKGQHQNMYHEVIEWEETAVQDDWGNNNPYCGFTFPPNMEVDEWEIIGNKFENPELLNNNL